MSDLLASILVKRQKKSFSKEIDYHGKEARITVDIRYDDECNNGHNTFSITGYIESIGGKTTHECGCIHEKIKKHFPEFKHLIKWHLTSSDGPMHYVANAIYFASDKDCWGKRKGEPKSFETHIFFNDVPVPHKGYPEKFLKWLQTLENFNDLEISEEVYTRTASKFSPHYSFKQYTGNNGWYSCPFNSREEAENFLKALQTCKIEFKEIAVSWGEGKEIELDKARHAALWSEAELGDFTKEKLEARLPALMKEFKETIESLGFTY